MFKKVKAIASSKGVQLAAIGATAMVATSPAHADITAVQTAIIAKIGEAETFGYALLAVGLVATIGITLVRKWAKKGIS